MTLNLIFSLASFAFSVGISFFLTPYIINAIGPSVNGFVQFSHDFINYASVLTLALNSMAGRFFTIALHQNHYQTANKYVSTLLFSNLVLTFVIILPVFYFIANIERFLDIPPAIRFEVKTLFGILIVNFGLTLIGSVFSIATFSANKIYLKSLRTLEANGMRALLLVIFFRRFGPNIAFIGLATLLSSLYMIAFDIHYTKKLLPFVSIRKIYFDFLYVKELVKSGLWNTVIKVGQLFLQGLDLLIANIMIDSAAMGVLAIAKVVPSVMIALVSAISNAFMPDFTILYAQNNIPKLAESVKTSMRFLSVIVNIPVSMILVYGTVFFSLWVPSQDATALHMLASISIITTTFSGPLNSAYHIFTITNQLKHNALILILSGIVNLVIVFLLLKTTPLGVYAITGVSTVILILRHTFFTATTSARYLGLPLFSFFPEIARSLLSCFLYTTIGLIIKQILSPDTWLAFIGCCLATAVIGAVMNAYTIFNQNERKYIGRLFAVMKQARPK